MLHMYTLIKYLCFIIRVLNVLLFITPVEQFLNKMKMISSYWLLIILFGIIIVVTIIQY